MTGGGGIGRTTAVRFLAEGCRSLARDLPALALAAEADVADRATLEPALAAAVKALELAPTVRVVTVCPGYMLTPMQQAEYTPEQMAAVNRTIPLGRHADPAEIAALFTFLASDEAPFITGSAVSIDGGETADRLASR